MTTTPAVSPRPLDGPFMSPVQMLDYSDEPGYAILPGKPEAERMTTEERRT